MPLCERFLSCGAPQTRRGHVASWCCCTRQSLCCCCCCYCCCCCCCCSCIPDLSVLCCNQRQHLKTPAVSSALLYQDTYCFLRSPSLLLLFSLYISLPHLSVNFASPSSLCCYTWGVTLIIRLCNFPFTSSLPPQF